MSKGKYAARSAKRQAEQATETSAAPRQRLDSERAAWQRERSELLNEVQRLRNKIRSDIDKAAAEEVAAVREQARQDLAELRVRHEQRAIKALHILRDDPRTPTDVPMVVVLDMAEALGVSAHEAMPVNNDDNRHARRRNTNKRIRKLVTTLQDIDKSGRGDGGLLGKSGRTPGGVV